MGKKQIAIFAEKLYGGGVEKILQIICRNFDYDRYDVTLYAARKENMPQGVYPDNLRMKYLFSTGDGLCTRIKNKIKLLVYYNASPSVYYKLFICKKYDVGIAFIEGYATRFLSGAPRSMKKIAWIHTDIGLNHWTNVAYRNRSEEIECYKMYDRIVCVSKLVEQKAQQILKINNIQIIHNPIEVDNIYTLSKEIVTEYNRMHPIRIVSIGSLIPIKGYDRLLRVAKRLREDRIDYELLILGEGQERRKLENYIKTNELYNNVTLTGYIDNPYPILSSADIYVCSSYAEGFNTAITEALVLGKAIVATDISGVREQLGDNSEYGVIVENSDDGVYYGLKQMLEPHQIEHYERKANVRGRNFNLETQIQKIQELIEE